LPRTTGRHRACNAHKRTLVTFERGPNRAKGQELFEHHASYILRQMKAGKILSAGPMADHQTAVILFSSREWNEAEEILKDERYTREGALQVARHGIDGRRESRRALPSGAGRSPGVQ
jgi:uncharacterized protein YciI